MTPIDLVSPPSYETSNKRLRFHLGSKLSNTRERLIKTATRLFARHGYEGTSVRDITEKSGLNAALVSYHFKGKAGLYSACLEPYGVRQAELAERILTEPSSARDLRVKSLDFCDSLFGIWLEHPEVFQIVAQECMAGLPVAEKLFKSSFIRCFEVFSRFFTAAQARKLTRPGLNPEAAAALLLSAMHDVMRVNPLIKKIRGTDLADPAFRTELVRQWVGVVVDGILNPTSKQETRKS